MSRFEHGQVVRIDTWLKEMWLEIMVIRSDAKHYFTAPHAKSPRKIACPDKWKIESLEAMGRVVLDLRVP